jgi:hypothetical protein
VLALGVQVLTHDGGGGRGGTRHWVHTTKASPRNFACFVVII